MRIVFMGTPDFAVPSLRGLEASSHDVALVVSQPDRPAGRGRRLRPPAVKTASLEMGLTLEQSPNVNADDFVRHIRGLAPDALVVVAFGQILSDELLALPTNGCVNLHASLLPRYRGTAPINWAIVNGERETGVTTMFMASKVDAGEIILQRSTPISDEDTAGTLSARLADMGAELLVETLDLIERGEAPRIRQDTSLATYARKLKRSDGEVNWSGTTRQVLDQIRGMTPWPGAYAWYGERMLRIERAEPGEVRSGRPGEIVGVDDCALEVATSDGSVRLLEVCPEGKCSMDAGSFIRGYRPQAGASLGNRND